MKRLFLVLAWLTFIGPAFAQTVTPQQAQNLVNDLQDPTKRAALIADLQTLSKVRPPPAKKAVTPVRVGTNVLQSAATGLGGVSDQILASLATMRELPGVVTWAYRGLADSLSRSRAIQIMAKLLGVFAAALIAGVLTWLWTKRLVHKLALMAPIDPNGSATPRPVPIDAPPATTDDTAEDAADTRQYRRLWYLLRLLPFLLARLFLDLVPVAVVLGVGYALLGTSLGKPPAVRLVGIAILSVLALERAVWSVAQVLVSPGEPRLRLFNMSDSSAQSVVSWTIWVSLAAFLAFAVSSVAGALGMPDGPLSALQKFLTLVAHLTLVAAVLRARKPVARWMRSPPGSTSAAAAFRNWLAAAWAWIAIIFILSLWFVWAIALQEGPARLLQTGGITLGVLVGARLVTILALGSLERLVNVSPEARQRLPGIDRRLRQYAMVIRVIFRIALAAVCLLLLFHFWGWDRGHWFGLGHWGRKVLAGAFTVLAALVCGAAVWELANFWLNRQLDHLTSIGALDRATRLRTLQPMLRTVLLVALLLVLGMTILSEIGVNIGPLLAGAGIVGLAIGFGSQKLVQDVITGLFLLLDNALEVGDGVVAGGLTGTVEHLSLCYLRLRGGDGTLHFIPYSSVTTVSNSNRGGQAVAILRFDFEAGTDLDKANGLLTKIGREMRADPKFAPLLLGDLALQGIEDINGNRLSISAQFPCVPSSSGAVIYEFRRRVALELAASGLQLAGQPPAIRLIAAPPLKEEEVTHGAVTAELAAIAGEVQGTGFARREAGEMEPLLTELGQEGWEGFAASWDDLGLDLYMADGGRYRRRRHAVFQYGPEGFIRLEHRPHYQSRDYNALNGGIARWFEPVTEAVAAHPALRASVNLAYACFDRCAPGKVWEVEVHQFRITAASGEEGRPTPEGVHRDGVDYVLVMLVRRENVKSGVTTIEAANGERLGSFTLTAPMDATFVDDNRVFHGVTPIEPIDESGPAWRDVLVATFRAV